MELCEIDGKTYVTVPEDAGQMPEQHPEITLEPVIVDAGLRDRLKKSARICQLIDQSIIDLIRTRYNPEDEMYFARIGVGVSMGAYQFEPGEQEALLSYGAYVEECRQWGRQKRAELGL